MSMANASGNQRIWGWKMASSLFLAGTAAGAYLVGFVMGVGSQHAQILEVSIPASAILAVAAVVMMLWHAGRKGHFVMAFARPRTSWMSRGAIALAVFFALALLDVILWRALDGYLLGAGNLVIGIVASLVAVFVLSYTGLLLKSLKPITFWDSAWLPALFLVFGHWPRERSW